MAFFAGHRYSIGMSAKLEEMMAYQEKQIADLSEMLIMQGRDLDALRTQIERLRQKIETIEMDGGSQAPSADQKPPHF